MKNLTLHLACILIITGSTSSAQTLQNKEEIPPDMGPQPEIPIHEIKPITPIISQSSNPENITWETISPLMQEKLAQKFLQKPIESLSEKEKNQAVEFLKNRMAQGKRAKELILLEFDKDKNGQLSPEEKIEMKNNPQKVSELRKQASIETNQNNSNQDN